MATLGTAYVQILPSTDGISEALQKGMGAPSQAAGQTAGTLIGSAMKKYITVAAIGTAIKKSVEEGAKLEQSLGGVETLYGKHAQTVIKNANKAYRTAGLSANSYMEQSTSFAASLLKSLGGNTKAAAKYADMAILDMADNSNKFGTNIVDIQNAYQGFAKQNYTMLDNLKLGFSGSKEGMQELLKSAEQITGKKYDINNLADVYDAIHVIQKDLGVTGTTSKEASETLAGSFASMKAAATNFLGSLSLGKNVGPALSGLVTSASTFLFDNLIPALLNIVKSIPEVLFGNGGGLVSGIISKLPTLIGQILSSATALLGGLADGVMNMLTGHLSNPEKAAGMMKSGLSIAKQIGLGLLQGIPQLLVAAVKLVTVIPRAVRTLLGSLFNQVKATVGAKVTQIVSAVKTKFAAVKEAFLKPVRDAKAKLSELAEKIKKIFNKLKLKISIKVPKVSVSGGKAPFGIGGKGSLPKFNVKWNDKAVNNPYMFNNATLFGAGETKDEILYGRDNLMRDIREASGGSVDYEKLAAAVVEAIKNIVIVTEVDGKEIARTTAPHLKKELNAIDLRNNRKIGYI